MRQRCYRKSGMFTIAELLDALHEHGERSLHRRLGNARHRVRPRLQRQLKTSVLFDSLPGGLYRCRSEKKLAPHSKRFDVLPGDLDSGQAFTDALIFVIVADYQKAYKTITEQTGFNRSTIYRAVKRLEAVGRIEKQNNCTLIEGEHSFGEAQKIRTWLLHTFGIHTPDPIPVKNRSIIFSPFGGLHRADGGKRYVVAAYIANRYVTVAPGLKGSAHQRTFRDCWYTPFTTAEAAHYKTDLFLWTDTRPNAEKLPGVCA